MKKLYYDSAYIRTFEAKVLSCAEGKKGYEVVLDQTAAEPLSLADRFGDFLTSIVEYFR